MKEKVRGFRDGWGQMDGKKWAGVHAISQEVISWQERFFFCSIPYS
jgi:hypothetical protein